MPLSNSCLSDASLSPVLSAVTQTQTYLLQLVKRQKPHPNTGKAFARSQNEEEFLKPCRMYEALTLPSAFPPSGHDVN